MQIPTGTWKDAKVCLTICNRLARAVGIAGQNLGAFDTESSPFYAQMRDRSVQLSITRRKQSLSRMIPAVRPSPLESEAGIFCWAISTTQLCEPRSSWRRQKSDSTAKDTRHRTSTFYESREQWCANLLLANSTVQPASSSTSRAGCRSFVPPCLTS